MLFLPFLSACAVKHTPVHPTEFAIVDSAPQETEDSFVTIKFCVHYTSTGMDAWPCHIVGYTEEMKVVAPIEDL